jgi:hypothetical protein
MTLECQQIGKFENYALVAPLAFSLNHATIIQLLFHPCTFIPKIEFTPENFSGSVAWLYPLLRKQTTKQDAEKQVLMFRSTVRPKGGTVLWTWKLSRLVG